MSVIKHLMWNYVGLVRTTTPGAGPARVRHLETEIERFYRATALTDGVIGLRNAVRTAVVVVRPPGQTRPVWVTTTGSRRLENIVESQSLVQRLMAAATHCASAHPAVSGSNRSLDQTGPTLRSVLEINSQS
jgi:hypothetical protein